MFERFAIHLPIHAVWQHNSYGMKWCLFKTRIFLHLYQICSANKWYRHQSTWDAPSLSHQSIPLVNRWSRLVVYLLKACSQWVSENTEANPPVPIIKFGCIHKHPSQKTHQGLAQCTVAGILGVFAGLDLGGQSYQTYEVVGAIWSSEWMLNADVLCWLWLCSVTMFYFMIFIMCTYCTMYVYIYTYILLHIIWVDSKWCLLFCVISSTCFIMCLIHSKSSHVWTLAIDENTWKHPKHGIIPLSQQLLAMSDLIFKLMWTYELHHFLRCWWQSCLNIKYWHQQSCCLAGTAAYFIRQHYFPLEVDKVQPSVNSGNGMAAIPKKMVRSPLHWRTITIKHIFICFKRWWNESEMMFQWII